MSSNKITNFIRKKDLFGHKVELRFDEKERERKSLLGGCVSIMITCYMFFFIISNLKKFDKH